MNRIVAITGGEGFVGRYICRAFYQAGWIVHSFDNRLKYGYQDQLYQNDNIWWHDVSTINGYFKHALEKINPNTIINCAASVGGATRLYNKKNPFNDCSQNIRSHIAVIEACRSLKKPPRIITISSSAIYERVHDYPTPEWSVCDIPTPKHWYGLYKYVCERLTIESGLNYTIVRLFNCAGEGDTIKRDAHVIPQLIWRFKQDDYRVFGEGTETRTITHCADVAQALIKVVENLDFNKKTVNIANSENIINIKELAQLILTKMNIDATLVMNNKKGLSPIKRSEADNALSLDMGISYGVGLGSIIEEAVNHYGRL